MEQMNKNLQEEIKNYDNKPKVCNNCESNRNDLNIKRTIFWKKYYFCSVWCAMDFEHYCRKNNR
jgi:hypothetical protein